MVQLTRIYTKGGDKGKTSLGDGARVFKDNTRVHALGDVDEANSYIGICCLYVDVEHRAILHHIQHDLFDLGADICITSTAAHKLKIQEVQVRRLEEQIDILNEKLKPLNSFVLPGGSVASSYLYTTRAIVRRAERRVVALSQKAGINLYILQYLNRLSDLLFVMARAENDNGQKDILWIPGKNQYS